MENMQEKIQAHEQRVRRLNGVWENFQRQQEEREQRNPRNIMFNALGGKDGRLNAPEKMNLVQKVLYASQDEVVNDGEENKKLSQFVNDLAEAIEKDTFYFEQANSIERINCETSTMNEYFTWIEEGQTIVKHMNDGEVTPQDFAEKNDFLDMSFQRETELLTCLGLYERSMQMGNQDAKVRFDELRLKLQKLREIRSSIETTCNHEVDHKVERREYEVALEYYRLIGLMRQMGARPTRTQAEEFRERSLALKVDHSIDVEMLPGYSFIRGCWKTYVMPTGESAKFARTVLTTVCLITAVRANLFIWPNMSKIKAKISVPVLNVCAACVRRLKRFRLMMNGNCAPER